MPSAPTSMMRVRLLQRPGSRPTWLFSSSLPSGDLSTPLWSPSFFTYTECMATAKRPLSKRQSVLGQFIRDIVFGTNDALLTNIGIITGFTASLVSNRLIILAVLVDIFTSAFAMATGTYLSRTSEDDYLDARLAKQTKSGVDKALANPIIAAIVMWIVYVISGFIPLLPFFFGLPPTEAAKWAVVFGALTFLVVGIFKGKVTNTSLKKSALQFFILGTLAALIGYGIGIFASNLGIN